jgi:basic membrane protein A
MLHSPKIAFLIFAEMQSCIGTKMNKQIATLGLTTAIAAFALAGLGTSSVGAQAATPAATMAAAAATKSASGIKVGLVTDVGRVDDRGFNQSSWEGVKASAAALGIPAEYIETTDPADYATNINALLDKGDNVIVTVGFNLADATVKAAAANPKVWFVGVDEFQDPVIPNVVGIVFNEDQSGFLAGVLAARMSKSGKVAGVYGASVPAVVRFKVGFENGAKYANPKISVQSTYYPGDISKAFNDPTWGATTAGQALDQGTDVVFAAGGGTGNGALSEVARRTTKDKPLFCIGVDTDQWLTLNDAHPCLLTSAAKLIPPAIDLVLKQAVAGTIKGGNFTGTVGLTPFHDFDTVIPKAVQDELTKLAADLASGKLATGYSAAPAATAAATMAATASK